MKKITPPSENPKVSVIIPVYNGEKYISLAIDSVFNQTYKNIEIIVVDDGSTDRTAEIIQSYQQKNELSGRVKLIYIYQQNQGCAAARNHGIANSNGEYIAFLDYDDLWLPEKIDLQVKYMLDHSEIGMVHSNNWAIDGDGNIISGTNRPKGAQGKCFKEIFIQNSISVLTVVIRKKCIEKIGFFDESLRYVEDRDLWLRLAREFPIGYIDQKLGFYRLHSSNMTTNIIQHLKYREKMFDKILKMYPDAWHTVGESNVKKCIFDNAHAIAANCIWLNKNYSEARKYYWKAVKIYPSRPSCWKNLLWCSLTSGQRRAFGWYLKKLQLMFYPRQCNN